MNEKKGEWRGVNFRTLQECRFYVDPSLQIWSRKVCLRQKLLIHKEMFISHTSFFPHTHTSHYIFDQFMHFRFIWPLEGERLSSLNARSGRCNAAISNRLLRFLRVLFLQYLKRMSYQHYTTQRLPRVKISSYLGAFEFLTDQVIRDSLQACECVELSRQHRHRIDKPTKQRNNESKQKIVFKGKSVRVEGSAVLTASSLV